MSNKKMRGSIPRRKGTATPEQLAALRLVREGFRLTKSPPTELDRIVGEKLDSAGAEEAPVNPEENPDGRISGV